MKKILIILSITMVGCTEQTQSITPVSISQQESGSNKEKSDRADDRLIPVDRVSAKLYTDGRRADVSLRLQKSGQDTVWQKGMPLYCGFSKGVCDSENCIDKPEGAVPEHMDDYFPDWDNDGIIGSKGDPTLIDFYPYPQEVVIEDIADGDYSLGIECFRDCQDRVVATVIDLGDAGTYDISTILSDGIDVNGLGRVQSNFSHMFTFFVRDGHVSFYGDDPAETKESWTNYMMQTRLGAYGAETCVYYEPHPVFVENERAEMIDLCVRAEADDEAANTYENCVEMVRQIKTRLCKTIAEDTWNCFTGGDDSILPDDCPYYLERRQNECGF